MNQYNESEKLEMIINDPEMHLIHKDYPGSDVDRVMTLSKESKLTLKQLAAIVEIPGIFRASVREFMDGTGTIENVKMEFEALPSNVILQSQEVFGYLRSWFSFYGNHLGNKQCEFLVVVTQHVSTPLPLGASLNVRLAVMENNKSLVQNARTGVFTEFYPIVLNQKSVKYAIGEFAYLQSRFDQTKYWRVKITGVTADYSLPSVMYQVTVWPYTDESSDRDKLVFLETTHHICQEVNVSSKGVEEERLFHQIPEGGSVVI